MNLFCTITSLMDSKKVEINRNYIHKIIFIQKNRMKEKTATCSKIFFRYHCSTFNILIPRSHITITMNLRDMYFIDIDELS